MTTTINSRSGEKGFTLVELSIVMIIIGLLIGGILKGQELIANARLAAGVAKIKAIDAAINTFRDSYAGLPGDINNDRLPNCAAGTMCGQIPLNTPGLNNNQIGAINSAGAAQASNTENITAWAQLSAADLVGGVTNGAAGANIAGGATVPGAEVPGQIVIGYQNGAVATPPAGYGGPPAAARAGHYLLVHQAVPVAAGPATQPANAGAAPNGTQTLTPSQASRFDAKLDDGSPNSGSVLAMGSVAGGAAGCSNGNTAAAIYNTANNQGAACGIYIRIQQ